MGIKSNDPKSQFFDRFSQSEPGYRKSPKSIQGSGGTRLEPGNGYIYHVYTKDTPAPTRNFSAPKSGTISMLVIGGGGSGDSSGGGGGAGGVAYDPTFPYTGQSWEVQAGTGGVWDGSPSCSGGSGGEPGQNSWIRNPGPNLGFIGFAGGGGAYCNNTPYAPGMSGPHQTAGAGGSDGGRGRDCPAFSHPNAAQTREPAPATIYQGSPSASRHGNSGGDAMSPGGGGGGAGSAGAGDPGAHAGPGGNGHPFPEFPGPIIEPALAEMGIPSSQRTAFINAVGAAGTYAGGGAGGGYAPTSPARTWTGGTGGGGDAAPWPAPTNPETRVGVPGVNFTGSGGGSGNYPNAGGGSGGHGICIIRYEA